MKMKSLRIVLASALSTLLIVSGCSGSGNSNKNGTGSEDGEKGSSGGKVEIRMAWWGSKTRNDATTEAIKLFEKKYPNIEVTPEFSGWKGYWSKLSTEISGGNGPDVMQMDAQYLRGYVNRDILMSLDNTEINLNALDQSALGSGKINGKLYAIPTGVNALVRFYDPALLKKAGITIEPKQQITWTKYANIATKIHKKLDIYGTPNDMSLFPMFKYYVRDRGEQVFSDDGKSLKFSKQTMVDWFNYWMDLQKAGVAPPAQFNASYTWGDIQKFPIVTGKTPFDFAWTNQYPTFKELAGRPIKITFVPHTQNGGKPYFMHPSMYWAISKQTEHPEASAKLVNFLLTSKKVAKIFGVDRGVPINSKMRKVLKKNANGTEKEIISFIGKVSDIAGPSAPVPSASAGQLIDLLHTISQKVQFEQLSPEEGVNQFFEKAQGILKESKDR